jgi:nucleoside-diphosphate-sugar epimerase
MLTIVTGYTGRNLTKYLHDNNLASEIRIVDKHLPELAWLAPEFKEACSRERFVQADAAQESAYHDSMLHRKNGRSIGQG